MGSLPGVGSGPPAPVCSLSPSGPGLPGAGALGEGALAGALRSQAQVISGRGLCSFSADQRGLSGRTPFPRPPFRPPPARAQPPSSLCPGGMSAASCPSRTRHLPRTPSAWGSMTQAQPLVPPGWLGTSSEAVGPAGGGGREAPARSWGREGHRAWSPAMYEVGWGQGGLVTVAEGRSTSAGYRWAQ